MGQRATKHKAWRLLVCGIRVCVLLTVWTAADQVSVAEEISKGFSR